MLVWKTRVCAEKGDSDIKWHRSQIEALERINGFASGTAYVLEPVAIPRKKAEFIEWLNKHAQ